MGIGTPGALNCSLPIGELNASGDIVGPGALAAFLTSSVITILAVLVAYLTNSLDEERMNVLDRRIVGAFITFWKRRPLKTWTWTGTAPPRTLSELDHEHARRARQEAFTRFILALSDQQLVTGLAILIGGVAGQNRLSIYEFSVVLSLAWFSSTTHLATLDALREYLKENRRIRDVRVGAMLATLVLLVYTFGVTVAAIPLDNRLPVQCVFAERGGPPPDGQGEGDGAPAIGISGLSVAAFLLALLLVLWAYASRVWKLYFEDGEVQVWCLSVFGRTAPAKERDSTPSRLRAIREYAADKQVEKLLAIRSSRGYLPRTFHALEYLTAGSVLDTIPGIAFSFSYGVAQLALYRWSSAPELTPESSDMGFGQILPVFLLVLPFLAAGEAHYDYKSARSSTQPTVLLRTPLMSESTTALNGDRDDTVIPPALIEFGERYDRSIKDIERFFLRRARLLREMEGREPRAEVLRRKKAVLEDYHSLVKFEKGLELCPTFVAFLLRVAFSVATGVLLNVSGGNTVIPTLVAIGLFVGYFGVWVYLGAFKAARAMRQLWVEIQEGPGDVEMSGFLRGEEHVLPTGPKDESAPRADGQARAAVDGASSGSVVASPQPGALTKRRAATNPFP
ncbi:uncharacterized protein DNG_05242 [Cephalotrichum gorgonifer]|uniref:Transmembrane protein n=1 Tax=Cephalotrichum gorgonifer TaxID=2041049 RepID=A0AAE8MZC5_9PEZI|nr:uncharacterized protein DNG_05242 [Cephalotrichum gorgonifer]